MLPSLATYPLPGRDHGMAAAASFSLSLARGGRGYPPRAKHQLHGAGLRRPKAPARPGINGKLSSGAPEREDALSGGTSSEQRAVVASHTSASTSPSPLLPSPVGQSIGSGEVDELLVGIIRDSPRQSQLCEGCKRLGRKLMGTRNVRCQVTLLLTYELPAVNDATVTCSQVRRVAPTVLPQHAFEGTNYILKKGVLTVICPDSAGIIGTVTSFLHMHGANIMDCQTNSTPGNIFTMRVEFCIPDRWLGVVR